MHINANTRIAAILKEKPSAIEAFISLNKKFEKLRNPLLRKMMAGRTSIAMASKMSGTSVDEILNKLSSVGFEIDKSASGENETIIQMEPEFLSNLKSEDIIELDVRPIIDSGDDPLKLIVQTVKKVRKGQALKIINTFEPAPLITLLKKQGFESWVDYKNEQLIETYFYKKREVSEETSEPEEKADWDKYIGKYKNKTATIDVRDLEMPQPMLTILDSLDRLPFGNALFVYHKRIPVFLLPELKGRKFDYRIKEVSDREVHLLIFRNND
ncbi:MAG: DUF2249 domain-containing protein [Ginsengibacter sp.]